MKTLAMPRSSVRVVGRRLLLIEQNTLLRRSFERFFRLYFDEVQIARDVASATATLQELRPPTDVICGLLENDGDLRLAESVERWRHTLPALIRVLVVTGCDEPPTHICGVDAVLKKPIAPETLISYLF